ncbi:MAG: SDR family NAD(P)-dependent oxidoreductase, partial [Actinobacteria bacterium]|nr:SDR family NAD(P)-dependent oxidoreductase [Actinomycetota bacterium]
MSKLTLKDLFAAKGKRHLTQVFVRTPHEAAACEEAGIDMLVANAGCDAACSFGKQSMADFRAVFDVGFFGSLYLTHAAWPHLMQQSYGRVVLTTSSAGLYGNHGQSAYAASK